MAIRTTNVLLRPHSNEHQKGNLTCTLLCDLPNLKYMNMLLEIKNVYAFVSKVYFYRFCFFKWIKDSYYNEILYAYYYENKIQNK